MGNNKSSSNELEETKTSVESNYLPGVSAQILQEVDSWEEVTLDVAVIGELGAGKSSLVNALRDVMDHEDGAALTGVIQTTVDPVGYPIPLLPNTRIWDLPGIGTPQFKSEEYFEKVNVGKYDFFLIVASECFTDRHAKLCHALKEIKKKFYYVRTKVDVSLDCERRKPNFSEDKTLHSIRAYCSDLLVKAGESSPKVFLVSRWDLSKFDFPLLQLTLENELADLRREVFAWTRAALLVDPERKTCDRYVRWCVFCKQNK